jgi:hypothetical protein
MRKRILEAAKNLLFQHLSNNIKKEIIFIILDMLIFLLLKEKQFRKDFNKVVVVKEDISRRNKNNLKRKKNCFQQHRKVVKALTTKNDYKLKSANKLFSL